MFRIRYNILAIIQVFILFINTVLIIRIFGTSYQADSYLIAISIVEVLGLLQLLLVEQFMYFYHDLKQKSYQSAYSFYNSAVFISLISSLLFLIILFFGLNFLVKFFAFNLDPQRLSLLETILGVLIFGVIFNAANYVNQRLLNAEMRFSIPYILEIVYPLFITFSLFYLLIFNQDNIIYLAYARVFGIFVSFIFGILFIRRIGIPITLKWRHPMLKNFIKNSFSMRLGHNIHNLLFNPIATNILSSFPVGYASCFYYAQMIILAINAIIVGPSSKVLLSKVSELWVSKKIGSIIVLIKNYLRSTVPIFIVIVIVSYFLVPYILNLISGGTLTISNIDLIKSLFLGLAIWYFVGLIESAFTSVGMASKNSRIFIFANSIFITLFFGISVAFKNQIGVMVIPIAAIIGQFFNLIFYSNFILKILGIKTSDLLIDKLSIISKFKKKD